MRLFTFAIGVVMALAVRTLAQCGWEYPWAPAPFGEPVSAMANLPNGDLLVCASSSTYGAIYRWNGRTWTLFQGGFNRTISSVIVRSADDIFVGGTFDSLNGQTVGSVVHWNGTNWSGLGSIYSVKCLAFMNNGDLIAGGSFADRVARWTGSGWAPLNSGVTNGELQALAVLQSGELVAGGSFTQIGGSSRDFIARWNGAEWLPFSGSMYSTVTALDVGSDGKLIASHANGRVRTWDPSGWRDIGVFQGNTGLVLAIKSLAGGEIVCGGDFDTVISNGQFIPVPKIAKWSGTGWGSLGSGITGRNVRCITISSNGQVIAGGDFDSVQSNTDCARITAWSGAEWLPIGPRPNGGIRTAIASDTGGFIIAGPFTRMGSIDINGIAHWNGDGYSPIGTGVQGVECILKLTGSEILVSGSLSGFPGAGVYAGMGVWNGEMGSPIGPPGYYGLEMERLPDGRVVTFGTSSSEPFDRLSIWSGGSSLSAMSEQPNEAVYDFVVMPSGDLIAGGQFTRMGSTQCNHIARWDGNSWSPVGTGLGWVYSLAIMHDGRLVAGGDFGIAMWDGTAWLPMGNGVSGSVLSLSVLEDGDLIAAGNFQFAGNLVVNDIARWNGLTWLPVADGFSGQDVSIAETVVSTDRRILARRSGSPQSPSIFPLSSLPDITSHPLAASLTPGSTASFSITAISNEQIHYQWRRNGVALIPSTRITGTQEPTLRIANVQSADQALYDCVVSTLPGCGERASQPANLSCKPIIVSNPPSFARLNAGMTLAVSVPSGATYTYRWRQNGQNLFNSPGLFSGVTTRTLTIQGADPSLAGNYDCVLTNACGAAVSSPCFVPCLADFNLDGAVDSDDVITYFSLWDANQIDADVNGDGGVDGDDIVVYFGRWDSGC